MDDSIRPAWKRRGSFRQMNELFAAAPAEGTACCKSMGSIRLAPERRYGAIDRLARRLWRMGSANRPARKRHGGLRQANEGVAAAPSMAESVANGGAIHPAPERRYGAINWLARRLEQAGSSVHPAQKRHSSFRQANELQAQVTVSS